MLGICPLNTVFVMICRNSEVDDEILR